MPRPTQDETPPDDSPRSPPPLLLAAPASRGSVAGALTDRARPRRRAAADRLPARRRGEVLRRLRRSARPGPARRERHPHDLALAGGRGRGRQDQVLDDVRARRLHALPLRRERHDLPLHPPQQRPHREARQPGHVRARASPTRTGSRTAPRSRPGSRSPTTATRATPRAPTTSTSRCTRRTAPTSIPFPYLNAADAAALRRSRGADAGRHARAQGRPAVRPVPACSSSRSRRCGSGPAAPGRPSRRARSSSPCPRTRCSTASVAAQIAAADAARCSAAARRCRLLVFTRRPGRPST